MMPPRAQDFNCATSLGSGNPRLASVKLRRISVAMILAGLMVLFGAAEDGMVFGIGSAQARIGRPLTPMSYAGVARRTTRRAYRRGYH